MQLVSTFARPKEILNPNRSLHRLYASVTGLIVNTRQKIRTKRSKIVPPTAYTSIEPRSKTETPPNVTMMARLLQVSYKKLK